MTEENPDCKNELLICHHLSNAYFLDSEFFELRDQSSNSVVLYFKQNSVISPDVIRARQMSIVIKATEVSERERYSFAYIVIPVAGDDHNPTMNDEYSSQIIKVSGDYSLDPPIGLIVEDEDPFPVDAEYNFILSESDWKSFFDVKKDASDNTKAEIILTDSFDLDKLPPAAGQISFYVEVLSRLN